MGFWRSVTGDGADEVRPVFSVRDVRDARVEPQARAGGVQHAVEDLPVAAADGHRAVGGHAHQRQEAVDLAHVLGVVDARAGLDDVGREGRRDAVRRQELVARLRGRGCQAQLGGGVREGAEGKGRGVVHLGEVADDAAHQALGAQRREAVLPEKLGGVPPRGAVVVLDELEDLPVPDAERVGGVSGPGVGVAARGEAELRRGGDEVAVHLHEDGGAELDGLGGVVVHVHGGGAAADVVGGLVDSDVCGLAGGAEAVDVVGCGGACGAGSCFGSQLFEALVHR